MWVKLLYLQNLETVWFDLRQSTGEKDLDKAINKRVLFQAKSKFLKCWKTTKIFLKRQT